MKQAILLLKYLHFRDVFSQGSTILEAKENIKEAIIGWLAVMNEKAKQSDTLFVEVAV